MKNRQRDFIPRSSNKTISIATGWDDGVQTMSLGEKAILTINSKFAYGARGFPKLIPPHSDLVFEVELLGINEKYCDYDDA